MPIADLRNLNRPIGPLKDKFAVTLSGRSEDYVLLQGFVCQVGSMGNIAYFTLEGELEQRETGLTAGDTINVGGVAVALRRIVIGANTTVTSIVVGRQ